MKRKFLAVLVTALLCAASVGALTLTASATSDGVSYGPELFPSPGFEDMLGDGETEFALSNDQRKGIGSNTNNANGGVIQTDGENVYLELAYTDGSKDDAFNNFFAFFNVPADNFAGDYVLTIDLKQTGSAFSTDNIGFHLNPGIATNVQIPYADLDSQSSVTVLQDGWYRFTYAFTLTDTRLTDIYFFFNTLKADPSVTTLLIDNVSLKQVIPDDDTPTMPTRAFVWQESEEADLTAAIDVKSHAFVSLENETDVETLSSAEYTYADGTITVKKDYLATLTEGEYTFKATTEGGSVTFAVTVYKAQPTIPDKQGYRFDDMILGGDFESYDEGLTFSEAQTDEAWGSLASYDDPGVIVKEGDNKYLRLKYQSKASYSSAFVMSNPAIQLGDILTLSFDYRLTATDLDALKTSDTNVCFVGGTNTGFMQINLNGSVTPETEEPKTEGAENNHWPVTFTAGENGWIHVETTFYTDFAFMNSTNSLRFLLNHKASDAELHVDNVRLVRWVDEAAEDAEKPVVTGAGTFDYNNPADVVLDVDLKDYLITSIKVGDATVATSNYSMNDAYTQLTVKKDYLATLDNGTHTFTLTTPGGSAEFTITVSNKPAGGTTDGDKKGCGCGSSFAVGTLAGGGALLIAAAVAFLILRRRKAVK